VRLFDPKYCLACLFVSAFRWMIVYIAPWWRYLLGYRLCHLTVHTPLFADFTRRYYNRSVTNGSFTNRVDHSLFLSTLLTVDYFRWHPIIHWRLSALVVSSLASYWLSRWLAHWLTDSLAGWLTDWLTDWLSRWLTHWLTDSPKFLS
jgi:hypothetical protein